MPTLPTHAPRSCLKLQLVLRPWCLVTTRVLPNWTMLLRRKNSACLANADESAGSPSSGIDHTCKLCPKDWSAPHLHAAGVTLPEATNTRWESLLGAHYDMTVAAVLCCCELQQAKPRRQSA